VFAVAFGGVVVLAAIGLVIVVAAGATAMGLPAVGDVGEP